jgi:hypothetical protein
MGAETRQKKALGHGEALTKRAVPQLMLSMCPGAAVAARADDEPEIAPLLMSE